MSSRLLRSEPAAATPIATPIVWRQAGDPSADGRSATAPGTPSIEAQAKLAELERHVEARIKSAYQQGQAASETAAAQRAAQRLDPVLESFSRLMQELAGVRQRFRAEVEEDTVKLAIAIARRVLHRELATDREAILGLVIVAFQRLNARETHRLRVSPADAGTLQQYRDRLELPPALEIVPDTSLPAGGAIFETTRGELDASVDIQLAEIEHGFADLIRRRAS